MSLGNVLDHQPAAMSERARRKTMTLQLPLAALSAANVVDAKYDSDSDFDYRQKPPRLDQTFNSSMHYGALGFVHLALKVALWSFHYEKHSLVG